jgi:hypothetical protein
MSNEANNLGEVGKKKANSQPENESRDLINPDSGAEPTPWHKELYDIQGPDVQSRNTEFNEQLHLERLLRFPYMLPSMSNYPILQLYESAQLRQTQGRSDTPTWHGGPPILPEPDYAPGVPFRRALQETSAEEGISEEDKLALRQEISTMLDAQKKDLPEVLECIRRQGAEPVKAILEAVAKNDVVFLGEMHSLPGEANSIRAMGAELFQHLPSGTRLAIELPEGLKKVFDAYNKMPPDAKFSFPQQIGELTEREMGILHRFAEDWAGFYEQAHKRGIQIVPIDSDVALDTATPENTEVRTRQRDRVMKDNVKELLKQDPSQLVVVWLGAVHGRDTKGHSESKSMIELLKEDKDLKDTKMTSFASQRGESDCLQFSLFPVAENIDKPVCVPTTDNGKPNVIGNRKVVVSSENLKEAFKLYTGDPDLSFSSFDNVIVFPRINKERPAIDQFLDLFFQIAKTI